MNHPDDRAITFYLLGDAEDRNAVAGHLQECPRCASRVERLQQMLEAMAALEVPEPDAGFEERVWARQRSALTGRLGAATQASADANVVRPRFGGLRPAFWGAVAAAALLVAFLIGLYTPPPGSGAAGPGADSGERDRILLVAMGGHLERSKMILLEVSNAERPADLLSWREPAQRLISDNRLYRQSARLAGEPAMAELLEEIERLLLDLARAPDAAGTEELEWLRGRVAERDLIFKVSVLEGSTRQHAGTARVASRGL